MRKLINFKLKVVIKLTSVLWESLVIIFLRAVVLLICKLYGFLTINGCNEVKSNYFLGQKL